MNVSNSFSPKTKRLLSELDRSRCLDLLVIFEVARLVESDLHPDVPDPPDHL